MKIIYFFLIFVEFQLYGQELFHRTLNTENGLPSSKVHSILKDSKGYIWFGTENGLVRWDSKNFKYYSIKEGLPNNEVLYVYEDSKGRLWISTFSNELCYLYHDTLFNRKNDKRLSKIGIRKGSLIVELDDKLYCYNHNILDYSLLEINLKNLNFIQKENKYIGNCQMTKIRNKFLFTLNTSKEYNRVSNMAHIYFNDTLYFYFDKFFNLQSKDSIKIIDFRKKNSHTINLKLLSNLLSLSYCDFKICQTDNRKYKDFEKLLSRYKLKKKRNYSFFEDRKVLLDSFKISPKNNFSHLTIFKGKSIFFNKRLVYKNMEPLFFLESNFVHEVTDNQKVVIGSENDVKWFDNLLVFSYSLDKMDNILHKIYKNKNTINLIIDNAQNYNLSTHTITKIPTYGKLYGLNYGYKNRLFLTSSKNIVNVDNYQSISSSFNYDLSFFKGFSYSKKHKLYTINNSYQGLFIQNLNKKISKISDLYAYTSYIDSKNRLWIATINMLYFTNTFLPKVVGEKEVKLDEKFDVFCSEINEDNRGNLFFTTNNGIYVIDSQGTKYKINDENLLSSNECVTLKLDIENNSFFVATRNGVNQIKYYSLNKKLHFYVVNKFFKDDGLLSNEIKDIFVDDVSLWVVTSKGLNLVNNKRFRPDTLKIPLYFNKILINDSVWRLDTFYHLNHTENNIKIDFSAIYFQRRGRLEIRYRLLKDGETTIGTIDNSVLHLFSLAPGNYTLQLYTFDRDYTYIKSDFLTVKFQINPPYYKTWWFFSIFLLLTSSIATYILRIRYIRDKEKLEFKNKRLELEKNLSKFKLEALKAEMNPHFIFNCLNSIKDFILRDETEKSQYYLSQLSKLIRIALYNTKEEFISLRTELEFIDLYVELEQLRFKDKFVFEKIIKDENLLNVEVPTMVLQPFFENAIRHGKIGQLDIEGKLLLEVRQENDFIVFYIKDNGIGLSKAAEIKSTTESGHKSMAMDIIQERIKIYNLSYNLDIGLEVNEIKDSEFKTEVILKYILD